MAVDNSGSRIQPRWTRFVPRTPGAWALIGCAIFSWTLFTNIPVAWGAKALTAGTGLGLSGLSGSAFNGRATNASVTVNGRPYPLGVMTWQFKWASLLTLKPCITLTTSLSRQQFSGDVCVGLGQKVTLKHADLSLPLAVVKDSIPLQVDGMLSASIASLTLSQQQLTGVDASLRWSEAKAFNGQSWMDMGAFGVNAKSESDATALYVVGLEGPIDADLKVTLPNTGGVAIKGSLEMAQSFIDATQSAGLLAMLGGESSRVENGRTRYLVDTQL